MMLCICVRFHENISNGIQLTELTLVHGGNGTMFNVQRAITPKVVKPELRLMRSSLCLLVFYNITIGIRIMERRGTW